MELFDKTAPAPLVEQSCLFTGHRVMDVGEDLTERLLCEVETLINDKGVTNFYAGGALGFDTLAADCVLRLKGKYPFIRLSLALPCKNQAERWSAADKQRYEEMLGRADSIHYVGTEYTPGCMHRRNDYMVANSKYCICYLRRESGGTYYTVNRAKTTGRVVILL